LNARLLEEMPGLEHLTAELWHNLNLAHRTSDDSVREL
jgi:hypothetical protein